MRWIGSQDCVVEATNAHLRRGSGKRITEIGWRYLRKARDLVEVLKFRKAISILENFSLVLGADHRETLSVVADRRLMTAKIQKSIRY